MLAFGETEDFELPSGEVVAIRALSGFEVMLSKKKYDTDTIGMNAFMLSCSMSIKEDAALEWLKTHAAGDFTSLVERIQIVSGLAEGAGKSSVSSS